MTALAVWAWWSWGWGWLPILVFTLLVLWAPLHYRRHRRYSALARRAEEQANWRT